MNKKILKVGNLIANPGEKIQGNITLKVSDDNIIDIPVTLINGIKEGKTVAITAAVHGGEYTGVFGLIKLSREISPQDLSGQLILVHILMYLHLKQKCNMLDLSMEKTLIDVFQEIRMELTQNNWRISFQKKYMVKVISF